VSLKSIFITWLLAVFLVCGTGLHAQTDLSSEVARANILRAKGAAPEAQKVYESVLPRLRAQGASADLATALTNLSDIATWAGEYDKAVALAHEGASVYRRLGDNNGEAEALNDAGFAGLNAGNYASAAADLEHALALNSGTGNARARILILNNQGNVYYYQARYSEALRAYESAFQIVNKSETEAWADTMRVLTLFNLATLYQRVGNYQRAIELYQTVRQSKVTTPDDMGHVFTNLGVLYRHMGDPEKALANYREAQAFYAEQKDADGELGVLKNTGIVLGLDLGRLQDALKTFDAAYELAEKASNKREAMQAVLYRAEVLFRMTRLAGAEKEFKSALALAEQLGTIEEQWKALYGLGRIAESNSNHDLAEKKFRDAITRIESVRSRLQFSRLKTDFFADKRDVYDALIRLLLKRNDTAAAFEYMERSRARAFQDRFFQDKEPHEPVSLKSIQANLDGKTALVEFWAGNDALAAIWVTRDAAGITHHELSAGESQDLLQFLSGLPENLSGNWQADFQRLNAVLASGIVPFTDSRFQHLLIVPDGFLSLIPFELTSPASGPLLLENHDLAYLPSAVLLLRGTESGEARFRLPWQRELLAFGDPAVSGSSESPLVSRSREEGGKLLPYSAEEIHAIAAMSAGRSLTYLGPADRKQDFFGVTRFKTALLHVSTHAIADMDNPERSRLLFSPGQSGEANNYVFLKELYDLDLRGTSLATLSACDTERGKLVPGEGVQAFSRALLSAGSKATLTTLWRVPDQPTAEFMKQFYYLLLKEHESKAEALRLTKLKFLHSGTELSHPRYWAAFVLNGEGSEPVPRFISWQLLALVFVALIFVIWVVLQLRGKVKFFSPTRQPRR